MFNEKPFSRGAGVADLGTMRTVPATGVVNVTEEVKLATNVKTAPAAADADTLLVAADAATQAVYLVNNSDKIAFVRLAAGASSANFNFKIAAGASFPLPWRWTGLVHARWEAAVTGTMIVTILKE